MHWFETWFDTPFYHILYNQHDFREAENFISRLTAALDLPKNSRIIDLACGKGRHSIFLNKLGYDVLGLDLSPQSIAHNQSLENERLHFKIHDMRHEISGPKADAVFNLFTSFGFFEKDEDDRKVFHSVAKALKKNGYFVLDFLNAKVVEENLIPHSEENKGGILFKIKRKVENHFIIKEIDFALNGKNYHFFEKVKLHTPEKIMAYAEEAGLKRVKIWGDYDLNDFDENHSPRCINVFVK